MVKIFFKFTYTENNSFYFILLFVKSEFNPSINKKFFVETLVTDEIKLCADHLYSVDPAYRFNYTLGEELYFILPQAVGYSEFIESVLPKIAREKSFGDIYALLT